MEGAVLTVALFATLAAVASAVFAFVQAKAATDTLEDAREARAGAESAQKNAEAARDRANEIADAARVELARSASALERANDLTEAALPKPEVRWKFVPVAGRQWACKNVGDLTAIDVKLQGGPGLRFGTSSMADTVAPNASVLFRELMVPGSRSQVTVFWFDERSEEMQSHSMPFPVF